MRILHASNGVGLEERFFVCGAAAKKELNELCEFARRSFQITGGTKIDFFVRDSFDRLFVGTFVALGEKRAILQRQIEIAGENFEWSEDVRTDVRSPRLPADFLYEIAGDGVIGIGVRKTRARRPADILRLREFSQDFEHRDVGRIVCVVDLAERHVVKACGVFKKIGDTDGIGGRPRIAERDLRRDVLQAGLQIDATFFFEFEKGERDEGLADGADAKFGVASRVTILREVGFADSAAPEDLTVGDECDAGAGDVLGVENFFCGGLKFFERFRMREFVFLRRRLLCRQHRRRDKERERDEKASWAHGASTKHEMGGEFNRDERVIDA